MTHYDRINNRLGPAYIAPPSEPVIVEVPGIRFSDTFDEPYNSSLANRPIGSATWTTPAGNAKIDKLGRANSTATLRAVMDAGTPNGEVSTVVSLTNYDTGLLLRWVDTKNSLRLFLDEGEWMLRSMRNGSTRTIAKGVTLVERCTDVEIAAKLNEDLITIYVDGAQVGEVSCEDHIEATHFGLYAQNGGDRAWDNFTFQSPSTVTVVDGGPIEPDTRPLNYMTPTLRFPPGPNFPHRVDPYTIGTPDGDNRDYWSSSGQVAYVPDDTIPNDPGFGATADCAYYRGCYATQPRWDITAWRGVTNPDPSTRNPVYIEANGGVVPRNVVAQVRAVNTRSNDCFVLWENGLITLATTQTGHGNVAWPWFQFPATKRVMDIALTSSNELMLVTLLDLERNVGQLAVFMVQAPGIPHHTFSEMGLPNQNSCNEFKLMGYLDIPLTSEMRISAASNGSWVGPSETNGSTLGQIDDKLRDALVPLIADATPEQITEKEARDLVATKLLANLYSGAWQGVVAKNGYCIITSKDENKLIVVDLSPTLRYIRESWLSSLDSFKATSAARKAKVWPVTYAEDPLLVPTFAFTTTVERPMCSISGHSLDRWSPDRYKAHVGTESGEVVIFDLSSIMARSDRSWERRSATIYEMGRAKIGENVCSLAFSRHDEGGNSGLFAAGKSGDGFNSVMYAVCRKSRKVVHLVTMGGKLAVLRELADQRLDDPVNVTVCERVYVIMVADWAGKKIVGFRGGALTNIRAVPPIRYECGDPAMEGERPSYEVSGILAIPGHPHLLTTVNVN